LYTPSAVIDARPLACVLFLTGRNSVAVMMKPPPTASLVVPESEFLLQFLIVALDSPAHFCHEHDLLKRCLAAGRCRKEVLQRLLVAFRPFD
jgi:hypothetical protein